ncbi:unnamed protein product [Zymoseptoria tritici ST99CH_1A5]|uniref:Uncharacterized protein n=1 Tax=Zymoseptoria tritici ST99CH_1A5 TaxID=1276529 RepID=A0A1Y6LJS7_ZYMTR|nr:unnamed protein product [Zymoseptoria tritici ST99CH_1A5]
MQFTTLSIFTTLTALAAARDSFWHVTDMQANCRDEATSQECFYLFNIHGAKDGKLPGFEAQCRTQSLPGDRNKRTCYIQPGHADQVVQEVSAYLKFDPRHDNTEDNELYVELKFTSGDSNEVQTWQANRITTYDNFVTTKDFDLIPTYHYDTTK